MYQSNVDVITACVLVLQRSAKKLRCSYHCSAQRLARATEYTNTSQKVTVYTYCICYLLLVTRITHYCYYCNESSLQTAVAAAADIVIQFTATIATTAAAAAQRN